MDETLFRAPLPYIFWYFLIISSFYVLLITLSIPLIYRRFKEVSFEQPEKLYTSETLPYIGVIITFHNEGEEALGSITNALNLNYPNLEVIVVNDDARSEIFQLMEKTFALRKALPKGYRPIPTAEVRGAYRSKIHSNLIVIDKASRNCKGDAVNAGINESNAELLVVVDSDTILEKDALIRMVRPFYEDQISGEGATLRILNGCTIKNGQIQEVNIPNSIWVGIQVAEYLRSFLYGRLGWNLLGGPLIISGAFGLFRREALIEVGGYDPDSIGEDFELTARLQTQMREKGHKKVIQFMPDPIAWTFAPESYKALRSQRIRWHQGLCEVLWKYKKMFFNPKYGMAGMINYPFYVFGEFLEPIVECVGYVLIIVGISLGYFTWGHLGLIFLLTWLMTLTLSGISILLEITTFRRYTHPSQICKLLGYSILENILLRPAYLYWRFIGIWRYLRGEKIW